MFSASNTAVASNVLNDRANGWRGMIRIESTGGNVEDVIQGQRHYLPQKLVYAEGDSWFDKFTPIPLAGTNLLDAIRTPFLAAVVDVSQVGSEAAEMVQGRQARQTKAMFDLFAFDAILLSAGGNDLKNLFAELFRTRAAEVGATGWTQAELDSFANPGSYRDFFSRVVSDIGRFIGFRDASRNNGAARPPIFINGYDYFQPRPSGAILFAGTHLGRGPWLYPAMKAAGLTGAQMRAAADAVIDEFNAQLAVLCTRFENVHLVDQRGLLKPARPDATGPDGDWMDEIHPGEQGFVKLARNRWDVPLATALGWKPASAADLVAAADPVNASTARPA